MRSLGALLIVVLGVLTAPAVAPAEVTFDHAFGVGVATGADAFERCTTATGCRVGGSFGAGAAGGGGIARTGVGSPAASATAR